MNDIVKNIFQNNLLRNGLILGLFILISIPISIQNVIIPAFKNQVVSNILDEAKRMSKHLISMVDIENLDVKKVDYTFKKELIEFQIEKAHYFDKNGKILYSTVKEKIGEVNDKPYFKEIVAKGELYYKIESKGGKTSELEILHKDIIEIYVPIYKDNKFYAAFELYYDISDEMMSYTSLKNKILTINIFITIFLSSVFTIFIYNASRNNLKIELLANTDVLTKLYNRRYFFKITETLIPLLIREKEPITLCMIDIDDFKNINDTYGHLAGDYIIQSVANLLNDTTRKSDVVARYGGEEFILLLPNTDISGAKCIAHKILTGVNNLELEFNDVDFYVTVSIGIAEHNPQDSLDTTIYKADTLLYKAKAEGKNQIQL